MNKPFFRKQGKKTTEEVYFLNLKTFPQAKQHFSVTKKRAYFFKKSIVF